MRFRDRHPRAWASIVWLLVTAIPVLAGWMAGKLHLPDFVYQAVVVLWLVPWIVVGNRALMVFFQPKDRT